MSLSCGIVGLPNVGKSTLFNSLLKKEVAHAANYPFATIEPNVGVIEVPDERLKPLAEIVETDTIVPAAIEFYDIAGLVKGASEGEGLGNKFLSHIRETDMIVHVVRLFEDSDITHVDDDPDPVEDMQTIETELILADLNTLSGQKEPKGKVSKEDALRWQTIQKVVAQLNNEVPVRDIDLSDDELEALKQYNLLTIKPVLYIFNVSESQLMKHSENANHVEEILASAGRESGDFMLVSAKLEQELAVLSPEDQKEYLSEFNLTEPGLDRLVSQAYNTLGLISFLTAGKKEARAWPIPKGTRAPQAAGTIHTDFEKKFIKAEIVRFDDFVEVDGWSGAREKGKTILGGKDYVMQDGDVVDFKIGA